MLRSIASPRIRKGIERGPMFQNQPSGHHQSLESAKELKVTPPLSMKDAVRQLESAKELKDNVGPGSRPHDGPRLESAKELKGSYFNGWASRTTPSLESAKELKVDPVHDLIGPQHLVPRIRKGIESFVLNLSRKMSYHFCSNPQRN